jgi:hypothetical protein
MKATDVTIISLAALALFPGVLSSQVMEPTMRDTRLTEIASVITLRSDELPAALKDVEDPFFPSRSMLSGKAPGSFAGGTAQSGGALAPDAVLTGVADLLRPSGLMMGASRRFIVSSLGDLYEVGKTVRITLPDGVHDIVVESADSEGYVLRCGGARLSRKFVDDSSSGPAKPAGK